MKSTPRPFVVSAAEFLGARRCQGSSTSPSATTAGSRPRCSAPTLSRSPDRHGSRSPTRRSPPGSGFGGEDAYPELLEKAAVLIEHLARSHPLPDGNKRAAFLSLERFLAANRRPILDADPDVDVPMVERVAAGEASLPEIVAWIESRTSAPPTSP